ncbi:MAG: twin-arginine translocase subunit TatB [Methylocystaceae bacterium]|nr:twin-arginine translocase subunit TatB [Methylocystaceae bacterium]
MLDIGWTEIAIILVIAILVVGPKDLPKAMRSVAKMVGKVKAMMREFQSNIDDMIKETELEEVKNQISSARHMNLDNKISETIDSDGELKKSMDFSKETDDFNKSMQETDKPAKITSDPDSKDKTS